MSITSTLGIPGLLFSNKLMDTLMYKYSLFEIVYDGVQIDIKLFLVSYKI